MRRHTGLILLGLVVVVAGCASVTAPIERWVGGNTFHSARFPAVNIKVSDALPFVCHEQGKGNRKPIPVQLVPGIYELIVIGLVTRSKGNTC